MKTTKNTKGTTSACAQRGAACAQKSSRSTTKAQVSREPAKKQPASRASMVASTRKK